MKNVIARNEAISSLQTDCFVPGNDAIELTTECRVRDGSGILFSVSLSEVETMPKKDTADSPTQHASKRGGKRPLLDTILPSVGLLEVTASV